MLPITTSGFSVLAVVLVGSNLPCAIPASLRPRSYAFHDLFVLQLDGSASPLELASKLDVEVSGPVAELADHYLFSIPKERQLELHTLLQRAPTATWGTKLDAGEKLPLRTSPSHAHAPSVDPLQLGSINHDAAKAQTQVMARLGISDPTFLYQWHLMNTVQVGHDLNVTGVWLEGILGEGVTTAIVDDGLDFHSQDIQPNYYANGSYDFNSNVPEPLPRLRDDHHGTLCAAEIAAAKNDICGVGVAYRSRVSGIRMLSGTVDDVDQATAMNFDYQNNDIYSCSWGPEDDGRQMKAPGILVQRAVVNGVQRGRGGKGSIYVFSAGNGASQDDNCNFDGYTNSIYSITVGAIDRNGRRALYSESCSALLVVAYSSGSGDGIYTTDNGDRCTALHSGTSAAAPLAAGVIALALSARPELTWRDVQYILVTTAVPVHEGDGSWQSSPGAGHRMYSHDWGYGKIDAYAVVQAARNWSLVRPQAWLHSPWQQVNAAIPEGHEGLSSYYTVTEEAIREANIARSEHVSVTMNANHTRRGDLSVELVSPSGMVSYLSTRRIPDDFKAGYVDWEFMSVAHWGEAGTGTWRVIVKDTNVNGHNGTFVNWRLNLWGEAVDGTRQTLHPLPGASETYSTMSATTTSSCPTNAQSSPCLHITQPTQTMNAQSLQSAPSPITSSFRHHVRLGSNFVYIAVCGLLATLCISILLLRNLSTLTSIAKLCRGWAY